MSKNLFHNHLALEFYQKCTGMPVPYLEIILEILRTLDTAGGVSSVRSWYPSTGGYSLPARLNLLEHSINVARVCMDAADSGIIRNLTVIAGLGHDLGKVPHLHPGTYTHVMHAYFGSEYIRGVLKGKLIEVQAEAIINAIRDHHVAVDAPISRELRNADRIVRNREMLNALGRIDGGRDE